MSKFLKVEFVDGKDAEVSGEWFCLRCETRRPAIKRLNALGWSAIGAFLPIEISLFVLVAPALAKAFSATGDANPVVPMWLGVAVATAMGFMIWVASDGLQTAQGEA